MVMGPLASRKSPMFRVVGRLSKISTAPKGSDPSTRATRRLSTQSNGERGRDRRRRVQQEACSADGYDRRDGVAEAAR